MTSEHIIRSANQLDITAMVGLLEELFSKKGTFKFDPVKQSQGLAMFLDGCRKHKCIKVADVNGKVVGMCSAQILISNAQGTPVALVEDMIVMSDYQRRGIGRSLIQSIEEWACSRGATRLQLLTDQTNNKALSFYQSLGWCSTNLICLRRSPY